MTAGSITVDGHDIRHLSRQDYRKQFGMVLQDAWLYEGTIKENLRFGNLEATDEEIVKLQRQPMSITLSGHSWWFTIWK